ncbi:MAG: glycosyltransferase family 2 protein [Acidobacteria bacterium]|nr:glycosyltransferase family 2 protein [Acidobacteriota bacterium]
MTASTAQPVDTPLVSVVLPIYNRRRFLPSAFDAIGAQEVRSLEIVVVDDGSTDGSADLVQELAQSCRWPVVFLQQENQGAYGARNTGVRACRGEYISFYDSDDVWLPQHLPTCVAALDHNPDVDWVYAACELVDLESGRLLEPSSFYEAGRPRPFMNLRHDTRGTLRVITDGGVALCQIEHGLFCGLQNSVLRRRVFERLSFEAATRNEAEDQVFAIRAAKAGFRLAYVDDVHVRYHVHAENSSGTSQGMSLAKRRRVYEPLVAGYERLEREVTLSPVEHRALRKRIGHDLFWHLGYNGYWAAGERADALKVFKRALLWWPWDLPQLKTFVLAAVRATIAPASAAHHAGH